MRALAGLVLVLVLAGCGEGAPDPATGDGPTAATGPAQGLQVRPVLGPADGLDCDPPFPGNVAGDEESQACDLDGEAFRLGPAAVVGGVERVTVSSLRGLGGPRGLTGYRGLGIRLEQDAAAALLELVTTAASSDSRVAVVVDGTVLNTLDVAGTVGGRLLLVGVEASREQAREYAARLTP